MKEFWFTRGAIPEFRHCSILTTPSSACLTYYYLQLCNISSITRGRQVNTLVLHMRIVIGWNKNSWLPFPVRNIRGSYSWNLKKIQETSYPYIHPKTQTQSTNDCTRGAIATETFSERWQYDVSKQWKAPASQGCKSSTVTVMTETFDSAENSLEDSSGAKH